MDAARTGRLPGPSGRRKEAASAQEPTSQLLASRSQARSLLLPADRSAPTSEFTDSGWPFRHLLTQPPTAPRNHVRPCHLGYCPAPSPTTSRTTRHPELTAESLCCHEPIQPRFSKPSSFPSLSEKHQAPHPAVHSLGFEGCAIGRRCPSGGDSPTGRCLCGLPWRCGVCSVGQAEAGSGLGEGGGVADGLAVGDEVGGVVVEVLLPGVQS